MVSPAKVMVMGATGRLGRGVVAQLLDRGVPPEDLVLGVRDARKAVDLGFSPLDVRAADYDDVRSLLRSFQGIGVLLLIPTNAADPHRMRQHGQALRAAVSCAVERIVFASFQACARDSRFARAHFYRAAESGLRATGLPWTILRSGLHLDFMALHIADALPAGELALPVHDGKVACISRTDIGRALAAACIADGLEGCLFELTGPEALSMQALAGTVSAATGRPLTYRCISGKEYDKRARTRGFPDGLAKVWRTVWEAAEAGELERVTDHVERLTGRAPAPGGEQLVAMVRPEAGERV